MAWHSTSKDIDMKLKLTAIAAAVFWGSAFAQTGTPNSPSSQRMQADVQRDVNQQRRIEQGVASGELTNREAARLERGQARDNAAQARAGADGSVGPNEQRRLQRQENRQSRRIYREKHDAQKQQ